MFGQIRIAFHRRRTIDRLAELFYPATERHVEFDLADEVASYVSIGVERGWPPDTTASVIAAVSIAKRAEALEPRRRERISEAMRASAETSELDWLSDYQSGRLNAVGMDAFLFRFRYTNGVLAQWLVRDRIDPAIKSLFVAMVGWSLGGLDFEEVTLRANDLMPYLASYDATPPLRL